jgi:hypothetical protein
MAGETGGRGIGEIRPTYFGASWDAYRAGREGGEDIARRQRQRLRDLVAYARTCSPYYKQLYRHVPEPVSNISQLPVMTKAELMRQFDRWVTDPAVTRASVEAFLADPGNIGSDHLQRYVVCTNSGATGIPAILLHDHTALLVYNVVGYIRSLPVAFLNPQPYVGTPARARAIGRGLHHRRALSRQHRDGPPHPDDAVAGRNAAHLLRLRPGGPTGGRPQRLSDQGTMRASSEPTFGYVALSF